jgi:hypothetical protein
VRSVTAVTPEERPPRAPLDDRDHRGRGVGQGHHQLASQARQPSLEEVADAGPEAGVGLQERAGDRRVADGVDLQLGLDEREQAIRWHGPEEALGDGGHRGARIRIGARGGGRLLHLEAASVRDQALLLAAMSARRTSA